MPSPHWSSRRPVTPRDADLGGDGLVATLALVRWLEEARVHAEVPRFRRLVEDGAVGPLDVAGAGLRP